MTGKEQLAELLKAFSENEALVRRDSLFKVSEREHRVNEVYEMIRGWLADVEGVAVEILEGGKHQFMATMFTAKCLRITLAKQTVQFNPVATEAELWFTIVGLADHDLRMDSDLSITSNGLPGGRLEADSFCLQLAHRVQTTVWG